MMDLETRVSLIEAQLKMNEGVSERLDRTDEEVSRLKAFKSTVLTLFTAVAAAVGFFSHWIQQNIFGIK